jgi:hypothetical protein
MIIPSLPKDLPIVNLDSIIDLRPKTHLPVRHISLSFALEDGVIEDLDKEAIVVRVML